ncbi:esterase [Flavobacterium sediminis]|uniref:Esterase n=1 Tax=Flavobacterium sediminis TaxID=2201181 RepID=A0A2U8QRU5_9FLAO|nr:alpha/beta hydrolase-fold protein [Flavobacterium sediminis]AWM12883.1 esterase [Flavobacterium sediminis]
MNTHIRYTLILICFILGKLNVNAQIHENQQFLKKIGIIDSLYSHTLKEFREIYIELPENYDPKNNKKYPVAYILDGEKLLPTVSVVQSFYSGGYTPEMVLIGISNSKNRTRDLTPTKIDTKYGMPFTEKNGEADKFYKFIEDELVPFVEKKYSVTNYRTLIGHSYGGLFTIYTLINHPQLFANYLAIDPSLDWDNQKLLNHAKDIFPNNSLKGKSLYMTLNGQLHMMNSKVTIDNVMQDTTDFTLFSRSNIEFSNLVNQNNKNELAYEWKFYPGDIHGTISFPSIMDGLISLFKWYQMEDTDKINSFDTPKEELFKIIKNRENRLKYHFGYSEPPYPEELLNMSGYMNMDMGQPEKAKMYFELAIKYYPESANTYDSMSEFYERMNDFDNALTFTIKAYEKKPNDYYKQRILTLKKKQQEQTTTK